MARPRTFVRRTRTLLGRAAIDKGRGFVYSKGRSAPMTDMTMTVVDDAGRAWIRVADVDRMPPFLVSVVSSSDHWLYASSAGGLTAGRVEPESSLFPYWTDDRLHRAADLIGPWTVLRVRQSDGSVTSWEPWRARPTAEIRRELLKSVAGDRLRLVETHAGLGMTFETRWAFSQSYGLVRTVTLTSDHDAEVEIIDGLQGVIPSGAPLGLVQAASCLVNAYARAEWDPTGELAMYSLEAAPSDRAEPAESLRANVVWCAGLDVQAVVLGLEQLPAIAMGAPARHQELMLGQEGAFLVASTVQLAARASRRWHIVGDVARSQSDVAALRARSREGLVEAIEREVDATTAELDGILADVDGYQFTSNAVFDAHHRANALFNAMRGGIPLDEYRVASDDFREFVHARNRRVAERCADWLASLPVAPMDITALLQSAASTGDADLARLAMEYLPLWFGRRHGDPSRPWNQFAIRVRGDDGERMVGWQGNWRDVFQNWEALLLSYPHFLPSVIALFVNATTLDGNNPYRVTSDGIDWEVPEPDNPWANLGYWGDHQVSYLTRLLESCHAHHPGHLAALLTDRRFSCADVPYRQRAYERLVADPRDAIEFDHAAHDRTEARVAALGADGRMVADGDDVLLLGLAEKLLIPVLAKLTAFVPGAGIWLNTQRPEWNDANNALAGNGVSVVTTAYLRRHVRVLRMLYAAQDGSVELLGSTSSWLDELTAVLNASPAADWNPTNRRAVMDALGQAGTRYRARVYAGDIGTRTPRDFSDLVALCDRTERWLDDALAAAHRPDGLVDGYDIVTFEEGGAHVRRLYPMLEGQVAMLAAGMLSGTEVAELVDRMYDSALYRPDVQTFILYPNRSLPSFLDRNRVPEERALAIDWVVAQLDADDRGVILRDPEGQLRFAPHFQNANDLADALSEVDDATTTALLDLWEETFGHQAFTGRSGTMYAYEGLGSVYWHMVGKLLLAVQECVDRAVSVGESEAVVSRLRAQLVRVREGLGYHRSPSEFGAVPTDPYSHTPTGRGAQQPGMTGLVKEELIARRRELGVRVVDGAFVFQPDGLDPAELCTEKSDWVVPSGVRSGRTVAVPKGALGFQLCGLPVVLENSDQASIEIHVGDTSHVVAGNALDAGWSERIFDRDPTITHLHIRVPVG